VSADIGFIGCKTMCDINFEKNESDNQNVTC